MAGENFAYWDFLKEAFNLNVRLGWLGHLPLNKLVLAGFGILGFGNPGFWLLGIAYEITYLTMLAGNPRFQAVIRGRKLEEMKRDWRERELQILDRLDSETRVRYVNLVKRCRSALNPDETGPVDPALLNLKSQSLNQLLMIFLKLLTLRFRIRETLARTRPSDLESDIQSLKGRLAGEPQTSPVRRALQGTLDIQQARLQNLLKSHENLKFVETELDRIEKQVSLIGEELALTRTPEQWSAALDGVVQSIQGTSKWMTDHADLFETMEGMPTPMTLSPARQPVSQK